MTGRSLRIGTLLLGSLVMFSSGGSSNAREPASLAPPSSGVPFATDFGHSDGGGCSACTWSDQFYNDCDTLK